MIKSIKNWQGYKNIITDYLDKYLIKCDNCEGFYSNYIYTEPINGKWAIRVPGATRGYIKIENGIIEEIELYEDSFCYSTSVYDELDKFIGMEIDLKTDRV